MYNSITILKVAWEKTTRNSVRLSRLSDPEWLAIDRGICSAVKRCSQWVFASFIAPTYGNPHFAKLGIDQAAGLLQAGGNMEGKEVRFGIAGSSSLQMSPRPRLTAPSNAMHDNFTPLGGGMVMANMMLDEVIVGALGFGLFGTLLFALLAFFVARLMVAARRISR